MSLRTEVYASIRATQTATPDLGSVSAVLSAGISKTLTSGTTDDKADMVWSDRRTIAGSGNETLDLAGSLVDALGATLTFAKVKAILITSDAANAGDLTIGNAASPFVGPFGAGTHTIAVRPGGALMVFAPETGWTVTATSADGLKIANGGGSAATYDIIVIGTSA